jgi:putative tryptophan/tyrosine transport system substrate-binding protein
MVDRRTFTGSVAGGLLAVSLLSRAQKPAMPVVGFLNGESSVGYAHHAAAFRQGLQESGYVDGQNVVFEYRWAEGHTDRLPALAAELIQRHVTLIAVGGGSTARLAAKAATTTVPIVFMSAADPVKEGLVASLNRPGGNITGVMVPSVTLDTKRLELLNDLVPSGEAIAVLTNPAGSGTEAHLMNLRDAARSMGRKIHILNAASEREIDAAFVNFAPLGVRGLLVSADPLFNRRRQQLIELTLRHRIPSISEWREFAAAGGLMSYGSNLMNGYREMGIWAGRILKGAKPAELPVLQASKFELVLNLSTARVLGLTIPQPLLLRADEVIQ